MRLKWELKSCCKYARELKHISVSIWRKTKASFFDSTDDWKVLFTFRIILYDWWGYVFGNDKWKFQNALPIYATLCCTFAYDSSCMRVSYVFAKHWMMAIWWQDRNRLVLYQWIRHSKFYPSCLVIWVWEQRFRGRTSRPWSATWWFGQPPVSHLKCRHAHQLCIAHDLKRIHHYAPNHQAKGHGY